MESIIKKIVSMKNFNIIKNKKKNSIIKNQ